jgi:hypothetical protein
MSLEDALEGRLHQFYQHTMCTMSRALLEKKARETMAGAALLAARGEAAVKEFLACFFYQDIPHRDKPEAERPPLKRRLAPGDEQLPEKRARIDPATLTDQDLTYQRCQSRFSCYKRLTERDACYELKDNPYDVQCLDCWRREYAETHCADCNGTQDIFRTIRKGRELYLCAECIRLGREPRVVRLKIKGGTVVQDCDVYIGRAARQGGWNLAPSDWANPFVLPKKGATDEDRAAVLARYEAYVRSNAQLMARLPELAGRRLGCWCAPKPCHGDVLVKLVKEWQAQSSV